MHTIPGRVSAVKKIISGLSVESDDAVLPFYKGRSERSSLIRRCISRNLKEIKA